MGQLYYAQTQLYSIVLGVKFSGQYELDRIAIHYSLLGVHIFWFKLGRHRQALLQSVVQCLEFEGARRNAEAEVEDVRDH